MYAAYIIRKSLLPFSRRNENADTIVLLKTRISIPGTRSFHSDSVTISTRSLHRRLHLRVPILSRSLQFQVSRLLTGGGGEGISGRLPIFRGGVDKSWALIVEN